MIQCSRTDSNLIDMLITFFAALIKQKGVEGIEFKLQYLKSTLI